MELLAFIKELLLLNDCVIIPGFGGFVSNYKPAGLHTARFTPPAKTVSFNKKLSFNDGLFINYIAEKESANYFLASRKLNLLVEEMNYRLTDGEEILIPEIGTLHYDDRENLIFTPKITCNLNPDAYGLSSFNYETLYGRKQSAGEAVPQTGKEAAQVIFQKRTLKKVLIMAPLLFALAVTPLKNNKENLQGSSLGNLTEMITLNEPVIQADLMAKQEVIAAEAAEKPVADHKYFVIGGSFKNEENAVNFFTSLKEEGYPACDLGIIQGLHYIAVESFATFPEAQKGHSDYTSKVSGSGAWIYIKK